MITLSVTKRDAVKGPSAYNLLDQGKIAGVVYGGAIVSTPITLDILAFDKVLREAGEATIISLQGLGMDISALIHEVDLDPLTNRPRHIDFYAITKGKKVEVKIPLEFFGESEAARAGANIIKVLHEIEVEADPMNLPHSMHVDMSVLKEINDQIRVQDLVLPAGISLITNPEDVIVLVQEVIEEKVEETPATDLSSIEVEKKGKEEEVATEAKTATT